MQSVPARVDSLRKLLSQYAYDHSRNRAARFNASHSPSSSLSAVNQAPIKASGMSKGTRPCARLVAAVKKEL